VAQAEQRRAEEVLGFVTSIFRDADPAVGPQDRPSASELLVRARTRDDLQFPVASAMRVERWLMLKAIISPAGSMTASASTVSVVGSPEPAISRLSEIRKF